MNTLPFHESRPLEINVGIDNTEECAHLRMHSNLSRDPRAIGIDRAFTWLQMRRSLNPRDILFMPPDETIRKAQTFEAMHTAHCVLPYDD